MLAPAAPNVTLRTMSSTRELMHSHQLLDNPRPPSMQAADTTTFFQVCTNRFESSQELPQDCLNLYLIHMLLTISLEAEYRSMLKQCFCNEPLIEDHGLQAFCQGCASGGHLEQRRPKAQDSRTTQNMQMVECSTCL